MGRRSKGTRLWLRSERRDSAGKITHEAVWFILDGGRQIGTGCGAEDVAGAENKLAAYCEGREVKTKYVYFVSAEHEGFPIKIGISESHKTRFTALQVALPYPLKVLAILPTEDGIFERRLHRKFAHLRLNGEWFKADPELISYIDNLIKERRAA